MTASALTVPDSCPTLLPFPTESATVVNGIMITPDMQQAVGQPMPSETHRIERGAILRFARAIGDSNPVYSNEDGALQTPVEGLLAPPTFLRSLTPAIPPLPDGEMLPRVLDGGSAWRYFEPVRSGDRLTVVTCLESLTEQTGRLGPMLLAVYSIEYTNERGQRVAIQRNTIIRTPTN